MAQKWITYLEEGHIMPDMITHSRRVACIKRVICIAKTGVLNVEPNK
jgi:hypothetical protein